MICHECAADAAEQSAVGLCRFCMVALCKQHLVELYRDAHAFPSLPVATGPPAHSKLASFTDSQVIMRPVRNRRARRSAPSSSLRPHQASRFSAP